VNLKIRSGYIFSQQEEKNKLQVKILLCTCIIIFEKEDEKSIKKRVREAHIG